MTHKAASQWPRTSDEVHLVAANGGLGEGTAAQGG